jgi:hypothetical protein
MEDETMEKLQVSILVMEDHRLGDNSFVKGKISGMMDCICETFMASKDGGRPARFGIRPIHGIGEVLRTYATPEEYVKLKTKVEQTYPGLCKFGIMICED